MTSEDERVNAIEQARRLIIDITEPKITPRVPKSVRDRARAIIENYPSGFDFVLIEKGLKKNG
jgi:hypothetical protein